VNRIPREARDGIMRAWLAILREKHPQFTWIAIEQEPSERESATSVPGSCSVSDEEAIESDIVVAQAA
jgi:hypothetical protein